MQHLRTLSGPLGGKRSRSCLVGGIGEFLGYGLRLASGYIADRTRAYGIFNTIYGGAWFMGSAVMGYLYVYSATAIVLFTIGLEGASIAVYFLWRKDL